MPASASARSRRGAAAPARARSSRGRRGRARRESAPPQRRARRRARRPARRDRRVALRARARRTGRTSSHRSRRRRRQRRPASAQHGSADWSAGRSARSLPALRRCRRSPATTGSATVWGEAYHRAGDAWRRSRPVASRALRLPGAAGATERKHSGAARGVPEPPAAQQAEAGAQPPLCKRLAQHSPSRRRTDMPSPLRQIPAGVERLRTHQRRGFSPFCEEGAAALSRRRPFFDGLL